MRLRPNLALFPLDDEVVVFSDETQCLIGLNASASLLVRRILAGTPVSTIERELVSEGMASPEEAAQWMATVLDALGAHGLLNNETATIRPSAEAPNEEERLAQKGNEMPAYAKVEPVAQQRYRLLDTCVLILFGHLGQVRLVNTVIGHLATDDESCIPTVTLEIHATIVNDRLRSDIYRDGKPIAYATQLSRLGPIVKGALWSSAINAHDFLFYVHAGVVGTAESCILLPARAGSGKSSLTAALTDRGFSYFSDEVALIERTTFQVPPMPLAICVKETGWELMARYYPDIATLPVHGREDGKVVRYIPPPVGATKLPPAPVSHIIFPRHENEAPTTLTPVARAEALGRLMAECVALRQRLDRKNAEELVRWIAGIDCYALTFSSLDEAVDLVAKVAPPQIL